mmetsp:Transcript_29893/g.91759  ORF Transcript_29893/g.91759 Transcript_29893/m.91759 type:complete len:90 (-) Transcript_29893:1808-2077(-)|eukprot:scaffold56961_cov26-Tisochrysis_lutea.AAC.1
MLEVLVKEATIAPPLPARQPAPSEKSVFTDPSTIRRRVYLADVQGSNATATSLRAERLPQRAQRVSRVSRDGLSARVHEGTYRREFRGS